MTREEEIKKNMALLGLTREQAEQMYTDDHDEEVLAKAALKDGQKPKRHYEKSDKPRKKVVREPKIDPEKVNIIEVVAAALKDYKDVNIKNSQREITFTTAEGNYSIVLTKHRK